MWVVVTQQHAGVHVAVDLCQFMNLEHRSKLRRAFVSKVMKTQIAKIGAIRPTTVVAAHIFAVQSSAATRPDEGARDRARLHCEDVASQWFAGDPSP